MTEVGRGAVIVDCAGAVMGGALRFLDELDGYLERQRDGPSMIGRGRQVTLPWLVEREVRAGRCGNVVALNNISFVGGGGFKTVLLRNALHFLTEEESRILAVGPSLRTQTSVVRGLLRRADRIVVPTSSMAERVVRTKPRTASRLQVMLHPLSLPPASGNPEDVILCPVLDAPYKNLGQRLTQLVAAVEQVRGRTGGPELMLTLTREEAERLLVPLPGWVRLLGRLTPGGLRATQRAARAIVYPTTIESFGYPLAEARLARRPVISPDTPHAREVAGDALVAYQPDDVGSLADAVGRALELELGPLATNPFDPDAYFGRLFSPC